MSKVIVTKEKIDAIADAIREKASSQDTYTLDNMPTAIENIPSGGGEIEYGIELSYSNYAYVVNKVIFPEGMEEFQLIDSSSGEYSCINYATSFVFPSTLEILQVTGESVTYDNLESIDISKCENLTTIQDYCFCNINFNIDFSHCTSLESIGEYAFENSSITSLDLSNCTSLISLGNYICHSITTLESISLPNSIESIGSETFYGCSNLTNVNLLCNVLGESMFYECSSLESISLENTSITQIPESCFSGCSSLVSIDFPSTLESIGETAFGACGFESLVIPEGVTMIGVSAFSGCSSLVSIDFPSTLESIGETPCMDSPIETVTIRAVTPPSLAISQQYDSGFENATIYVPAESVNAYKAASGWSDFANQIQAIPAE